MIDVRPSEDTMPELTREQKDTLDAMGWQYDEVGPCRMQPNGTLIVQTAQYTERGRDVREREIKPSGVPF